MKDKSFVKKYQAHIFVFGTLFFNALNSVLILIILIILGVWLDAVWESS